MSVSISIRYHCQSCSATLAIWKRLVCHFLNPLVSEGELSEWGKGTCLRIGLIISYDWILIALVRSWHLRSVETSKYGRQWSASWMLRGRIDEQWGMHCYVQRKRTVVGKYRRKVVKHYHACWNCANSNPVQMKMITCHRRRFMPKECKRFKIQSW